MIVNCVSITDTDTTVSHVAANPSPRHRVDIQRGAKVGIQFLL